MTSPASTSKAEGKYARVRALVRMIPAGQLASYGMIASLLEGVTPRMVGFVMAGLDAHSDVPWQRVVNAAGGISPRPGSDRQRLRLEDEGVTFDAGGQADWSQHAWAGPDPLLLDDLGIEMDLYMTATANWPVRR